MRRLHSVWAIPVFESACDPVPLAHGHRMVMAYILCMLRI